MKKLKCPWCHNNAYKTLKKGNVTRCCDSPVVRVNGAIYKELDDAPEWRLIQAFVAHKRKKCPQYEITYCGPGYKEAVTPVKLLLQYCKGDVELALEAIDVCFTDGGHKWKDYSSPWALVSSKSINDVLARARQRRGRNDRVTSVEERLASAPALMA
jgi:hypothetical protein